MPCAEPDVQRSSSSVTGCAVRENANPSAREGGHDRLVDEVRGDGGRGCRHRGQRGRQRDERDDGSNLHWDDSPDTWALESRPCSGLDGVEAPASRVCSVSRAGRPRGGDQLAPPQRRGIARPPSLIQGAARHPLAGATLHYNAARYTTSACGGTFGHHPRRSIWFGGRRVHGRHYCRTRQSPPGLLACSAAFRLHHDMSITTTLPRASRSDLMITARAGRALSEPSSWRLVRAVDSRDDLQGEMTGITSRRRRDRGHRPSASSSASAMARYMGAGLACATCDGRSSRQGIMVFARRTA